MAKFELKLPKMGESVAEATITSWLKDVGDKIELDEPILEIATDKVDSEVPSEVEGVLMEKLFDVDEVVKVGATIAIIETESEVESVEDNLPNFTAEEEVDTLSEEVVNEVNGRVEQAKAIASVPVMSEGRFYSPLVRNIAKEEGISQEELDSIPGSGKDDRVTKDDILMYLKSRELKSGAPKVEVKETTPKPEQAAEKIVEAPQPVSKIQSNGEQSPKVEKTIVSSAGDEIIEMTRMGKLISHHMMESINTSAHVQSFIEADVTNIWNWRNNVKDEFEKREGEKLTFTPIFLQAVAKALRDYPMMNISLDGDKIIKKKAINIGMAAALPDGNLIVPVIKNADQLNLVGLTKQVNDLANRARQNQLKPDEIQGGTYTVTNVGTFGSIMGTPIINQPQVGILALGAIRKVPAVVESPQGDFIGIRYRMFLSHSYDHRVVNGALGGQFVKAVKDYLEGWKLDREI
ncbi:dihydrolipoamide acetyltransferase family protein [Aegicerativicinus sediminis]